MKKKILILVSILILINISVNADTLIESEPDENLWMGYNGRHVVRGSGSYSDNIVIVYENDEENDIKLKLSTNGGTTFGYTYDVDSSMYSNDVAIAIDSSNVVHIVYHAQNGGAVNGLRYKTFTLSTRTFSSYTTLWDYPVYYPVIALDSNDNLYVVYEDTNAGGDIIMKKYTTGWSSPTTVFDCSSTYDCDLPDIEMDYDDTAHIVWRQDIGDGYKILHRKITSSGVWGGISTIYNDYSLRPALAIDSNGYIHVVWDEKVVISPSEYEIKYSHSTDGGSSWTPMYTVYDPSSTNGARHAEIGIDGANNLYVFFESDIGGGDNYRAYLRRKVGGSWQSVEEVGYGSRSYGPSRVMPRWSKYNFYDEDTIDYLYEWQNSGDTRYIYYDSYSGVSSSSPVMINCPDDAIYEDDSGSGISVDLYACTTDSDNTDEQLTFAIDSQSNSNLINCYIANGRYINCDNPQPNGFGYSDIVAKATDPYNHYDTDTIRIIVTAVDDPPEFSISTYDDSSAEGPTDLGNNVTFIANVSDPDGEEQIALVICDNSGISGTSCSQTQYCRDPESGFKEEGNVSCKNQTSWASIGGFYPWTSFALDDENNVVDGSDGEFYVLNLSKDYTQNVTMSVNSVEVWSHSGYFIGTETTNDFSEELNDALNDCTADEEGYCDIPITLHSDNAGRINVSNISIYYNITEYVWDTKNLAELSTYKVRIKSSDGYLNSSWNESDEDFTINRYDYLKINSLSVIYQDNTERIFNFNILNRLNYTLENISWSFDTGEINITSDYNLTLKSNESGLVYLHYNYTSLGDYMIIASVYAGNLTDSETINITI